MGEGTGRSTGGRGRDGEAQSGADGQPGDSYGCAPHRLPGRREGDGDPDVHLVDRDTQVSPTPSLAPFQILISFSAPQPCSRSLGVTIHASHAVVTLRSAADAEETVRLLKDHDFRPGVRVTLLVTGVQRQQVNKPAQPNASSVNPGRSSQLPTPPPNVAVERIEDEQIDSSSGEDVPISFKPAARINHQIGVAGPGPSSLASAATVPVVPREKKRKIIRHPTLSDSDDDVVTVVAQRASTAKRAKGVSDRVVPRPDAGESSRFRIKAPKVTKPVHVAGDKTRRFLVDDDFLFHASMRGQCHVTKPRQSMTLHSRTSSYDARLSGRVNVWSKDTYEYVLTLDLSSLGYDNVADLLPGLLWSVSVAADRLGRRS